MLNKNVIGFALVLLLSACGDYQREYVTLPTNYSVNQNHLTNGSFDIWQRGFSVDVGHADTKYQADRWYVTNELGPASVVRYSREKGLSPNSKYAARVEVKQSPNDQEKGGVALYQTLEAGDSQVFIEKTASFSALLKAVGKVNRVGIQFMFSPTEVPVSEALGQEEVVEVSDKPILAKLQGVEIRNAFENGGTLGIRIRVLGVSEGNTYDRGNGFTVDQAILNQGPLSADFQPKASSFSQELRNCLRYYEKSYDLEVAPFTESGNGVVANRTPVGGDNYLSVKYSERKRVAPELIVINHVDGQIGNVTGGRGGKKWRGAGQSHGESEAVVVISDLPINETVFFQWIADAEIYPKKP